VSDNSPGVGGYVVIGGTLLMAAMDGALLAILLAGGGAFLVYKGIVYWHGETTRQIYKAAEAENREQLDREKNEQKRRSMERQARQKLSEMKDRAVKDRKGVARAAAWIAIGTFAFPFALIGAAVGFGKAMHERRKEQMQAA